MLSGPRATVTKARNLRRAMTWPEIILWRRLRQRPGGLKFRRQHPAGAFVLDFFCSEARLAIEIDGIAHDMGAQPVHDRARDQWLKEQGVDTIRIAAGDVTRSPDSVFDSLVSIRLERSNPLHQLAAGPPPRPGEETI